MQLRFLLIPLPPPHLSFSRSVYCCEFDRRLHITKVCSRPFWALRMLRLPA